MCFPSCLLISRVVCFYVTFANELQVAELVTSLIVVTKCPAEKLQEDRVHLVSKFEGTVYRGGVGKTWQKLEVPVHIVFTQEKTDREVHMCAQAHTHTHTHTRGGRGGYSCSVHFLLLFSLPPRPCYSAA